MTAADPQPGVAEAQAPLVTAMPDHHTLYDDWKARREQLASLPYWAGDHRDIEAHVLDYLLRRYRDAPEGTRPARFPLATDIYINDRAIVVLHHVGSSHVPAVTSASEAQRAYS